LDVHIGFLHATARGKPALALDLIEPLRTGFVDRWVLRTINRRVVSPGDFEERDGGVFLRNAAFKRMVGLYRQALEQRRLDPLSGKRETIARLLHLHVERMATAIRTGTSMWRAEQVA
ncbi:MAG: subtype I-C CRISPR-associated endonuclease Cas1, partial [Planctomycetota bacterium]